MLHMRGAEGGEQTSCIITHSVITTASMQKCTLSHSTLQEGATHQCTLAHSSLCE